MGVPALIVGVVIAIYGQTWGHGFVNFDDPVCITDNPRVLRGLTGDGTQWALTTGLTGMWQPLTWLSLMANVTLAGPGAAGFHAANVALHAASAVMLYAVLLGASGAMGRSLLVALMFAAHPLNVEAVAWASQRKSTLSTLLGLISLYAWVRHLRTGSRWAYGGALAAFALGLLAKPMLVSLPCIFALLAVWPLPAERRDWPRLLGKLAPFFLLAAAAGWICLHPFGPTDVAMGGSRWVLADVLNTPLNIVTYLIRLGWPTDLAVLYPRRADWSGWACGGSLAALVAITWVIATSGRRVWLVGWGWFMTALMPVSGIIPIGPHATADRYVYLPAIGLFIAAAWTLPARRIWFVTAGVVIAGWAALAFAQVGLWRDSATLWRHTAELTSPNPTLLVNFGAALAEAGHDDVAVTVLRRALELKSDEQRAWLNLAYVYDRQGNKPAALAALKEAVRRVPGDARIHNHLGSVLQDLGRDAEAEAALRLAITLKPEYAEPWVNLGVLFATRGDLPAAVEAFTRAVEIQPNVRGGRENLLRARKELAGRGK